MIFDIHLKIDDDGYIEITFEKIMKLLKRYLLKTLGTIKKRRTAKKRRMENTSRSSNL